MNLRRDFELENTVETIIVQGTFEIGLNAFCIMILLQAYGDQGMEDGSLDVTGPHNLTGNGSITRCGFVGIGMILLEDVCYCGGRL